MGTWARHVSEWAGWVGTPSKEEFEGCSQRKGQSERQQRGRQGGGAQLGGNEKQGKGLGAGLAIRAQPEPCGLPALHAPLPEGLGLF